MVDPQWYDWAAYFLGWAVFAAIAALIIAGVVFALWVRYGKPWIHDRELRRESADYLHALQGRHRNPNA